MLSIVPVKDWKTTLQFLDLPHVIHNNPASRWIAPLKWQERFFMGRLQGPQRGFWLVLDDERPVARIGAMVHQHKDGPRIHFGFFECAEGYPEAVPMLVERVASLAPDLGMVGPFSFEMEDPYTGILVDGFEHDPTFLVSYNPPYYGDYLEQAGLSQVMDLYSYLFTPQTVNLERMATRAARAKSKGIEIRKMNRWRWGAEMRRCIEIADKAWVDNWGFEEFKEEQIQALILFATIFFEREGVVFARHSGRDIAFAWVIRNFNQFLKEANGKVTARLIWQMLARRTAIKSLRGYALGVLPEFQSIPAAAALVHHVMQMGYKFPWSEFDLSWVLADNVKMNALARALGGVHHKTHRIYERLSE